jgi:hypothetical protein
VPAHIAFVDPHAIAYRTWPGSLFFMIDGLPDVFAYVGNHVTKRGRVDAFLRHGPSVFPPAGGSRRQFGNARGDLPSSSRKGWRALITMGLRTGSAQSSWRSRAHKHW